MTATFIDAATGAVAKPTSLKAIVRRSFVKPGETGSRRYPFRVPGLTLGMMRAEMAGESLCFLDESTNEVHRVEPNGDSAYLYTKP